MNKEVYLIRHGQTDYNVRGIVQGRGINSDLNAKGIQQAEAFYKAYQRIPFQAVYTSELKRTQQTVNSFIAAGIPHFKESALDEIDWGIYEGVESNPEMHARFLEIVEKWRDGDLHRKIEGGESAHDLLQRQLPFIEKLRNMHEEVVLVCSHGRSIRSMLCAMTDKPISEMDDFPHLNTTLYKLTCTDGEFRIDLFNNTDHLNGKV